MYFSVSSFYLIKDSFVKVFLATIKKVNKICKRWRVSSVVQAYDRADDCVINNWSNIKAGNLALKKLVEFLISRLRYSLHSFRILPRRFFSFKKWKSWVLPIQSTGLMHSESDFKNTVWCTNSVETWLMLSSRILRKQLNSVLLHNYGNPLLHHSFLSFALVTFCRDKSQLIC